MLKLFFSFIPPFLAFLDTLLYSDLYHAAILSGFVFFLFKYLSKSLNFNQIKILFFLIS